METKTIIKASAVYEEPACKTVSFTEHKVLCTSDTATINGVQADIWGNF